ncbi:MAG: sterol carrier family protein [Geodermatophilaceae bacterium]
MTEEAVARWEAAGETTDRATVAEATRYTLGLLTAKAPGRSVEVRVPPYAAVQCVGGPRHTRGTPPNTVETDPQTWLRLASGRQSWTEAMAAGALRVSGERADLTAYLPLISRR